MKNRGIDMRGSAAILLAMLLVVWSATFSAAKERLPPVQENGTRQLECAALYRLLVEIYPANWQTIRRESMNDRYVLLRSVGRRNLQRAGKAATDADRLMKARITQYIQLAENNEVRRLTDRLPACKELYDRALHED
ncbi:hypothetical protein [Rhizobium sullae]|nr:hypothetical protein [Rhizobium sullae]